MRERVGVLVVVVVVGCGWYPARTADAQADAPPAGTLCGDGVRGGMVYCDFDAGTMCCLVDDERGFGYMCIPETDECAALTVCPGPDAGHPGVSVCPPQQICLDNGTGLGGCAAECLAPIEPCGDVCCTEAAYCERYTSTGLKCLPCRDGGCPWRDAGTDAVTCPPERLCVGGCCPDGTFCQHVLRLCVSIPDGGLTPDAALADGPADSGAD